MNFSKFLIVLRKITKVFLSIIAVCLLVSIIGGAYYLGLTLGYIKGKTSAEEEYLAYLSQQGNVTPTPSPTPIPKREVAVVPQVSWGGPELWEAVNKRRQELGVNPLSQRDELCTIASIRLNQLLDLGKLDGHEGFSNMKEKRPDLAWIFERYSTIAEFLAFGGRTAQETVSLWENTLGHRKLLEGGEYVWGCIYAQETFAVAITAF